MLNYINNKYDERLILILILQKITINDMLVHSFASSLTNLGWKTLRAHYTVVA